MEVAILIAVVTALTELIKRSNYVQSRFLPSISLVIGTVIGAFYLDMPLKERILYGMIIGLAAAGLFDQSKLITKKGE